MIRNRGIPIVINAFLAIIYVAVNVFQFFVLPLWLLPKGLHWAWVVVPLALLTNPFWSLIHEAIHDLFHPKRAINAFAGRALAIFFGSPFRILRMSHLVHHKLNRLPAEGTEYFDRQKTSKAAAAPGYFFQILVGLYLVELISPLFFFLPRVFLRLFKKRCLRPESVSALLMQNWQGDEALREIRRDGLLTIGGLVLSFYAYGANWPVLVGVLVARGLLISFLDNVYHYETPVGDIFYAKNLRLATPLSKLLLNFNLHGIHHINPAISWINLPQAFQVQNGQFQSGYFAAAWRQLHGPVALQDLPRPDRTA